MDRLEVFRLIFGVSFLLLLVSFSAAKSSLVTKWPLTIRVVSIGSSALLIMLWTVIPEVEGRYLLAFGMLFTVIYGLIDIMAATSSWIRHV